MQGQFFSIIIPTYNRANFICTAIESVIGQTYKNWELIIVDDGSTDNTKEIISSYNNDRIRYIYQENQERSIARNNGINNARGEYICFLDSDDYFLDNHLTLISEHISLNNSPVAMFYIKPRIIFNREFNTYEVILKSIIHPQHTCIHSKILKTHLFNPILRIAEDIELWMRIAEEYPLINIDNDTVVIQEHDGRTVNFLETNSFQESLEVFRSLYKDKRWRHIISFYVKRTTISDCYFGIAKYHMYQNNRLKALGYSLYSIIVYPNRLLKHKIYSMLSMSDLLTNIFKLKNEYKKTSK